MAYTPTNGPDYQRGTVFLQRLARSAGSGDVTAQMASEALFQLLEVGKPVSALDPDHVEAVGRLMDEVIGRRDQ